MKATYIKPLLPLRDIVIFPSMVVPLMFLGDSGSYLFGSLVALNTIVTDNLNSNVSSFFLLKLLL